MVANSSPNVEPSWVERIANKYFAAWVWSIVIGITSTSSLSLVNYYPRARGPFLLILLVPLLVFGALAALAAWYSLVRYFERYIVPVFFFGAPSQDRQGNPHVFLERAVRYSFASLAFRLLLSLADLALSSAYGF